MFFTPSRSDNYFYTKLFDFSSIATDQKVSSIYLVNDTLGFLLASDDNKIMLEGRSPKEVSAIFFRSVDGGRTFEKQIFGKGVLDFIDRAVNDSAFYMLWGRFTEKHDRKPCEWVLLRSTDFGKSWENIFVFKDKYVTEVLFFDDKVGFAFVLSDPIESDVESLYKTEDGGESWKLTDLNTDELYSSILTHDGKLMGLYTEDELLAYWETSIDSLKPKQIDIVNPPEGVVIRGPIGLDPITNQHYINLVNFDERTDHLYCLETQELIEVPSPCYYFNVYGNYIGVDSEWSGNSFINQYHYSTDKGKTWHTETPPGSFPQNPVSMYGKGHIWMMCMEGDNIQYPIMVRIPPKED